MLQRLGLKEGEAIVHPWINKALEKAQQKVEARNFEIRKQLLKYDDVMNDQRKVIYEQRRELMQRATTSPTTVADMRHEVIDDLVARASRRRPIAEQWDIDGAARARCRACFGLDLPVADWAKEEGIADEEIRERVDRRRPTARWPRRPPTTAPEVMRMAEKSLLLQILDQIWKEHLLHARPSAPGHRPARLRASAIR